MYYNPFFKAIVLFFCLLVSQIASAQDNGNTYSLEACIDYALKNAVAVKNAVIDNRSAAASVKEIRADGLPQVNGEVRVIDNYNLQLVLLPARFLGETANPDSLIAAPFGVRFTGNADITLNQLIFDGTFFLGLKAAKTYKEMAQKNLRRAQIETVESIMKAYYGALISEARLELAEENYLRLDTLFRQTTAMYENGFSEKIDVDRIRVNMNNAKTQLTNLKQMNDLSIIILKFQMGMKVSEEIKLEGNLADIQSDVLQIEEQQLDYNNRIDYSINETQKELDKLNIKRFQSGYYPSLYAFTSLGANSGANSFGDLARIGSDWFSYGNYGFRLSVPIFDGMRKRFQVEQARLSLIKTENTAEQLANLIETEYSQSIINLESSMNVLDSEQENMELADEIYRISNTKFQQGVGSSFELVDAETALTNSQTNYYNALYNALISKVDYLKAIGKLDKE
ncbi:MAG: TolC family protein [Bacteroidota bacterium]